MRKRYTTSLVVRTEGWTSTTQRCSVAYTLEDGPPTTHAVTLTWDGSTDRPNTIACDCGKRSCVPLRLVRDLERHGGLPLKIKGERRKRL